MFILHFLFGLMRALKDIPDVGLCWLRFDISPNLNMGANEGREDVVGDIMMFSWEIVPWNIAQGFREDGVA